MSRFARLALLLVSLVAVFAFLLLATYAIPRTAVRAHMPTSIGQLELEGHPYHPLVGLWSLTPDNFTDALMLNVALAPGGDGLVRSAFANDRAYAGQTPTDDQVANLRSAFEGDGTPITYARYWHGYLVVLRPLLTVLDYRAIRFLNWIALAALVVTTVWAVSLSVGRKAALALVVALIVAGLPIVPFSMQFSSVFYLALTGLLVVAHLVARRTTREVGAALPELFLVLGALTAFFDLLTAPLLTLLLPLALVVIASIQRPAAEEGPGAGLRLQLAAASSWIAGFAGTWAAKWALSSLVLGRNVFADAAVAVGERLGGAVPDSAAAPSAIGAIGRNLFALVPAFGFYQTVAVERAVIAVVSLVPAALLAVAVVAILRHPRPADVRRLWSLAPVALAPYVWYALVANHSWMHFWFTYRVQAATAFVFAYAALFAIHPRWFAARARTFAGYFSPRHPNCSGGV